MTAPARPAERRRFPTASLLPIGIGLFFCIMMVPRLVETLEARRWVPVDAVVLRSDVPVEW